MLNSKKKATPLAVSFHICLYRPEAYSKRVLVQVKVDESLPPHMTPEEHIRQRINEELSRQAGNFAKAEKIAGFKAVYDHDLDN